MCVCVCVHGVCVFTAVCVFTCVCVCVCVFTAVCVHFEWVKCRALILSIGNHTWPHDMSLSFSYIFSKGQYKMMKCTFFGSDFEILSPILTSRVSISKPYGLILTNAFKTLWSWFRTGIQER